MRVFTLCLLLSSFAHAEPWRAPRPLDDLYARAAADLRSGRPLVVAGYYGLWVDRSDDPDRNLNWGTYYGNARMLRRARKDRHVRKLYRYPDWRLVHEAAAEQDPVRTLVFHQRVRPNARWRAAGVTAPFDAYLVMQAFASQEAAARGMTRNLRRDQGGVIELPDGVRLDVGAAQITGYVGHNLFYDSEEQRKRCCRIRKVEPLRRYLSGVDAYVSGLRREQNANRADTRKVEFDRAAGGVVKLNPLADWSSDRVWRYVDEFEVPVNRLHAQGYPSVGCAPCTRAVKHGEDPRAGRWWWENDDTRECGIHLGEEEGGSGI